MNQPFDRHATQLRRVTSLLGECMARREIDLWLIYTRESSRDPLANEMGLGRVVARGAGLFSLNDGELSRRALVASYDTTPVEESGIFQQVIGYNQEGIAPHIRQEIEALDPTRVALNFSRDVAPADGLSHGMRRHLEEILGAEFFSRVVSSEPLVMSYRGRKLPEELAVMAKGIEATQQALDKALTKELIRPGTTRELDIAEFLDAAAKAVGATVLFAHVMVGCCRGHADATDRVIQPGDLLRIDYGIDYEGYSSDIQRTAYILKPGESGPPDAVGRLFETTLQACQAGISALQPGARGRDVDFAARSVITGAGYDEYPHASGHAIGVETHELGPILGPPWKERYGTAVEQVIEAGMIYAVEPAAYVDLPECGGVVHVGLEEDVEVTADGPKIIGTPQTELVLI